MASMVMGSAQGAVDSLIGRLTSALVDEALMLGGVRGDMQFIKDEMESMNGFLLHLAEADDGDHRMVAWKMQVAEVAQASQNCLDNYVRTLGARSRGSGVVGFIRRLPWFLWTLPARHSIASQIQELKIRSCEVAARRQRYGVEAPRHDGSRKQAAWQEESRWGGWHFDKPPKPECVKFINLMKEEGRQKQAKPSVIVFQSEQLIMAVNIFDDQWVEKSCFFNYKVRIDSPVTSSLDELLRGILEGIGAPADQLGSMDSNELEEQIRQNLRGKKFLLSLECITKPSLLEDIKSVFQHDNYCSPGSAILLHTCNKSTSVYPDLIFFDMKESDKKDYYKEFYLKKAMGLLNNNRPDENEVLSGIIRKLLGNNIILQDQCKMFLRTLYANPYRTSEDFKRLHDKLHENMSIEDKIKIVLPFIYSGMSGNCKKCLLYLVIFPIGDTIRRNRLVRRWAAEGIITKRGSRLSTLDEADRTFDELVAHGLVVTKDTNFTGKVKSCAMPTWDLQSSEPVLDIIGSHLIGIIPDFVMTIAGDQNFVKTNLPPDLSKCLPVNSVFNLQQAEQQLEASRSRGCCWNICNHFHQSQQIEDRQPVANGANNSPSDDIKVFLESIPLSTRLGLEGLEVLDLEDCKELKNHHLKNICNHVFQLKYLSLRNTDITELPKQIDKLLYLETLDIRKTKVNAFPGNNTVLPKLKHLLAGDKTEQTSQDGAQSDEKEQKGDKTEQTSQDGARSDEKEQKVFQMPERVAAMTELQVLSHVTTFSNDGAELRHIGNLLQLRKLGVILHNACQIKHLYRAIGCLSSNLLSLSVQVLSGNDDPPGPSMIPKFLQKLEISGLKTLPSWVNTGLVKLTKITLHETALEDGAIETLGKLPCLLCLCLRQGAYSGTTLCFNSFLENGGFKNLEFLIIECSKITNINFTDVGATPALQTIVWSSTGSQSLSLSGIENLRRIKKLKLIGNFNMEEVWKAISKSQSNPVLETN